MAYRDRLQANRFELKYIVDEDRAVAIRDFVSSYLEPDDYYDRNQGCGYLVASLYLDAPDLKLYRQTVRGLKNRFKLRIRFYDDKESSPAFLEIKRRANDAILKKRTMVTRDVVKRILEGGYRDVWKLLGATENFESAAALHQFCDLCTSIGAERSVYVSYRREAYQLLENNQVRVTFDRHLESGPPEPGTELSLPSQSSRPNIGGVIVELKYTDRFPTWMRDLARTFDLRRCSAAKYVECVDALQSRQVSCGDDQARIAL